jgi:hypothetical protein
MHRDLILLGRNLIEEAERSQDCPIPNLAGRLTAASTNVGKYGKPHQQTLASQDQQTPLPHKFNPWPAVGYRVQARKI